MTQLYFTCSLYGDLVLSSKASTEGFYESLDYIPGAKFLGVVAKELYNLEKVQQTLDIFHNGRVRFGDAHPLCANGESSLRIPYSWLLPKGATPEELHHQYHFVSNDSAPKDVQLKQVKAGYFTQSGKWMEVEQKFSIKSAYDRSKYRSKDQQMYGYYALKKGTVWTFRVDVDDTQYVDLIRNTLAGVKFLGRSSSAEYGKVVIEETRPTSESDPTIIEPGEVYLYATSNLCFYDHKGENTIQPDAVSALGLPAGSTVLWDKSSILSRPYITWNRHRDNRNPDRQILLKGSVLAISLSKPVPSDLLKKGVGAHRSEGFGQVLINPSFLQKDDPTTNPLQKAALQRTEKHESPVQKGEHDERLIQFLDGRLKTTATLTKIDQAVSQFIEERSTTYTSISSSQWGNIRNIAKNVTSCKQLIILLFDSEVGYCYVGQAEIHWRKVRHALEDFLLKEAGIEESSIPDLAEKLSSEMAKVAQNKEQYEISL